MMKNKWKHMAINYDEDYYALAASHDYRSGLNSVISFLIVLGILQFTRSVEVCEFQRSIILFHKKIQISGYMCRANNIEFIVGTFSRGESFPFGCTDEGYRMIMKRLNFNSKFFVTVSPVAKRIYYIREDEVKYVPLWELTPVIISKVQLVQGTH